MRLHRSLAGKLLCWGFVGSSFVLALVVGLGYVQARSLLEEELEAKARELAQATANRMAIVTESLERTTETVADLVDTLAVDRAALAEVIARTVERNAEIYGSALALLPREGEEPFAPYVYRDGDELVRTSLAAESYRFDVQDWFVLPRHGGAPQWSEPYYDEGGGNVLMATYSAPLRDGRGDFRGVVTADLSLPWLTSFLKSLPLLGPEGFTFLLSAQGTVIAHPDEALIMNETLFSLAKSRDDDGLAELGRHMIGGEAGFGAVTLSGQTGWTAFAPVGDTGWSLAVFFPRSELLRDVATLSRTQGAAALIGMILLLAVIAFLAQSITKPLRALDGAVQALAGGDDEAPLPDPRGTDEVSRLTASFAVMREELRRSMAELARTAQARERIESELRIGRAIQMSLIPKTFPPFPTRSDFALHALLEPAREVGGDFYDFFLTDDDHLCLAVGDVSGKGVPAALFMAVTRTFLKALAREERSPSRVLERLNDELAEGNDASMFVTLFFAVVDLRRGLMRYASGGHPSPLVARPDGTVSTLPRPRGPLVGALEGMTFDEGEKTLERDDRLLVFTDGVTEAMTAKGELFGDDRTARALSALAALSCREIVAGLRERLVRFADGADQSDDIALLLFTYSGKGSSDP
ncbi:MAG: SpoIIE family protein phosphatase [Synergistaceae bacterium]|nr:SpoIIE family protein phosphatase [Synergistaceae bacterium]